MKPFVLAALCALCLAGAASAMAQPAQAMSNVDPAQLPRVFAAQVRVSDLARSAAFYRDALGAARIIPIHEREAMAQFASGPGVILVAPAGASNIARNGPGGFILQVADIEAAVARVRAAGGVVERPPNDGASPQSHGVRAAMIRDPDGVLIELIQMPAR